MERNLIAKEIDNLAWSRQYDSPEPVLPVFTREQKEELVKQIVAACNEELKIWKGKKETDEGMLAHVRRYWKKGPGMTKAAIDELLKVRTAAINKGLASIPSPWSAAFVTFVMKKAYPDFKAAQSHSKYISWAKTNRTTQAHPFQAFPVNEVAVEPGDIICQARSIKKWATYENVGELPHTHGDIVIRIENGYAVAVGGNINMNVQEVRYELDSANQLVQKKDRKWNKPLFFAVIKIVPFSPVGAGGITSSGSFLKNRELEISGLVNIPVAVSENRRHGIILGWENHLHAISKYVFMKPLVTNETQFVREVADWQKAKGLAVNGIIDENLWELMKGWIPKATPGEVVSRWTGSFISKLKPDQKNNLVLIMNALQKSKIRNRFALAGILAVTSKETDFGAVEETSYRNTPPQRIREIFRGKIDAKIKSGEYTAEEITDVFLTDLAQDNERFFNFMYGVDGNKYRGKGFNQLTGKDVYKAVGLKIGVDLVNHPEEVLKPAIAAKAVPAYFKHMLGILTTKNKLPGFYNALTLENFVTLKDAVLACYHANAGVGYVYGDLWPFPKDVKDKSTIGQLAAFFPKTRDNVKRNSGMRKSLERAEEMLQLIYALDKPVN